jgi:hypothetical protein
MVSRQFFTLTRTHEIEQITSWNRLGLNDSIELCPRKKAFQEKYQNRLQAEFVIIPGQIQQKG